MHLMCAKWNNKLEIGTTINRNIFHKRTNVNIFCSVPWLLYYSILGPLQHNIYQIRLNFATVGYKFV